MIRSFQMLARLGEVRKLQRLHPFFGFFADLRGKSRCVLKSEVHGRWITRQGHSFSKIVRAIGNIDLVMHSQIASGAYALEIFSRRKVWEARLGAARRLKQYPVPVAWLVSLISDCCFKGFLFSSRIVTWTVAPFRVVALGPMGVCMPCGGVPNADGLCVLSHFDPPRFLLLVDVLLC